MPIIRKRAEQYKAEVKSSNIKQIKSGKSHQRFTALSVGYEKDVFAFFVERVELPHLTCNSKTILQEKISLIFNIRQFVFSKKFVE